MDNILVTGSNGQLGSEIRELIRGEGKPSLPKEQHANLGSEGNSSLPKEQHANLGCEAKSSLPKEQPANLGSDGLPSPDNAETIQISNSTFFFTDKDNLNISDEKSINEFITLNKITTIINCGAYTAVDKAQDDEATANLINHLAVRNLAQIAKEKNIKFIHISTDYVFDGTNFKPYTEDDKVNPKSVYGQTKLDGENEMLSINPANSIIIRTSWVYSSFGANFVKTMLRLGKEKDSLGVIFDQVGTPTYARDLAKAILEILPQLNGTDGLPSANKVQIYHYSNEGVLSWYDFAKEIMRMAKLDCIINPIETKEYPTPAKRPHYSLLNKAKIKNTFNIEIPYWKDSLDECLKTMGERK